MCSFAFGRYELIGRLKKGGMGEIYLARCPDAKGHEEEIALKVISPEFRSSEHMIKMFLDEGHIVQAVAHPNVVRVHEVGEEGGVPFIAMELLSGISLDLLYVHVVQQGLRLPPDLVAALMMQVASGLHAAHELRDAQGRPREIVHRDISPHNLFCLPSGIVKVIDFGIARSQDRLIDQTAAGFIKGKPAYLSPEQARAAAVDRRSDVFAVAIVLHELVAGRPLFRRENNVATLMAVVMDEAPRLSSVREDVSPWLDHLVATALAKDPAERPSSAAVLASGLEQVVAEAGGRFASPFAIARYLGEHGIELLHPVAQPLTEPPDFISVAAPGSPRSSGSSGSLVSSLDGKTLLLAGAAEARGCHSTPDPGTPHPAVKTREGDTILLEPAFPATSGADPFTNHLVDLKYRLLERLDPEKSGPGALPGRHHKRWYLAEELLGEPGLLRAGASSDQRPEARVAIALVGKTERLQALDPDAAARLQDFAGRRSCKQGSPAQTDIPLVPVLRHGLAWPDGPSYLVTPYHARTLRSLRSHLAWRSDEQVLLARTICEALRAAVAEEPGYVHGALEPGNLALLAAHGSPYQVVLLDFDLEVVLGTEPLPQRRTLYLDPAAAPNFYLAPERLAGVPPTAAADVFALGVILYELLGGDPGCARRSALAGTEIPRLPPRQGLPDHMEAAVFAALRRAPEQRPTIAQLCRWLDNDAGAGTGDTAAMLLVPPPPGEVYELRIPDGRSLAISSVILPAHRPSQPALLPMSAVSGLLPVPLLISLRAGTLVVEPDRRGFAAGGPSGAGSLRASLYHNAHDPNTRCESYTLTAGARGASFDVGHRKSRVQTIHYSTATGRTQADALRLPVEGLPLELSGPEGAQQLVALHTMEPQSGKIHLACVAILR